VLGYVCFGLRALVADLGRLRLRIKLVLRRQVLEPRVFLDEDMQNDIDRVLITKLSASERERRWGDEGRQGRAAMNGGYDRSAAPTDTFIGGVYGSFRKAFTASRLDSDDRFVKLLRRFYFRLNTSSVRDVHSR
jgi:hypothetical protein